MRRQNIFNKNKTFVQLSNLFNFILNIKNSYDGD